MIIGLLESLVLIYIASYAVQGAWSYFTMEKFKWDERMVGISLGAVGILVATVQGGLIRIIIPKLGNIRSVYLGLALNSLGFLLFAFATEGWMMFVFLIPYCLGGIAGPAIQGIISTQVSPSEQGELQGGMTSLMSMTAIVGPPLMMNIFSYFTNHANAIYFPGAPMLAGAVFSLAGALFAYRTLSKKTV
jgi:DHA1 family tetracycline resistance protein-like MFS transporter